MPPAPAVEEPKRERRPKKRLGLGPRSGLPARIHQVVITFCKIFQAKVDAVLSCHRSRKVARARQAIAHFLSVEMAMTSSPVGRLLKRDHTTILDSKRVVIGLLDRDAKFSARYHRAVRALRAMWAPQ